MHLAGKTALVTGAGRGIGKGCALELARAGANLILNDRPESPDLRVTADEVRCMGIQVAEIPADVFSRAECERLFQQSLARDEIDILVSNPAYSWRCDFLSYDPEQFERVLAGTLHSGFHLAQLVARRMVARGNGGKIVFISSVQAEMPIARCVAYGAAKAGLNHMARSIAVELSAHRINVNVVEPGWIDTPAERATFGDATIREKGAKLPWGRLGLPADVGKAVVFLASDDADYITGTVLTVDGGFRFKDCRADAIISPGPRDA